MKPQKSNLVKVASSRNLMVEEIKTSEQAEEEIKRRTAELEEAR